MKFSQIKISTPWNWYLCATASHEPFNSGVKLKVLGVGCWAFLWHVSVCQLWIKLTNQMTQNLKLTHSGQRSEMKLQKVKQVLRGFRWLLWQPISRGYDEVDTQIAPGPCYSAPADCYWQTVSRCSAVTFTASHWNIKEMQAQRRKKPLCTWGGIKSSTEYSVWPFVSNIVLQSWFSTSFCVCSEKVECTRSLICAHEDFKKGMVKVGVLLSCLKELQKASRSDGCDLCPTQRSSLKKRRWHFLRVCVELGCGVQKWVTCVKCIWLTWLTFFHVSLTIAEHQPDKVRFLLWWRMLHASAGIIILNPFFGVSAHHSFCFPSISSLLFICKSQWESNCQFHRAWVHFYTRVNNRGAKLLDLLFLLRGSLMFASKHFRVLPDKQKAAWIHLVIVNPVLAFHHF